MTGKNPRNAGRKPRDGGTVPTTLRLTQRERETLAVLGDGDMTAGLRVALYAVWEKRVYTAQVMCNGCSELATLTMPEAVSFATYYCDKCKAHDIRARPK
jgi:hypothetical protein